MINKTFFQKQVSYAGVGYQLPEAEDGCCLANYSLSSLYAVLFS